ncbi:DUF2798 domain-containing protein [Wohlfahrtiimonas larvae]|uniref:DUF2798 domain-containing protein n=1 Tax=Wohlfahrtiimonas larvae TaxID=1157986 RepID=UPI002481C1DB|nr:DUF2798 domain-containing protein [Wohlfahrtiimonas larvae]
MSDSQFNRYKLPPKAMHLLVPFFLSFSMSCIVSCISVLRSVGFANFHVNTWAASWMISWAIAFPSVLILLPLVRKFSLMFIRVKNTIAK